MYTFDAIILEIHRIHEKQCRIVLLSREYGKITAWFRKGNITGVDIGDIAHVVIERRESMNRIKHIDSKYFIIQKKWDYQSLFQFLSMLSIIKKYIGDAENYPQIYDDYLLVLRHIDAMNRDQVLLLQIRILKQMGYLDPSFYNETHVLRYIYTHINTSPLSNILGSKPLHDTERAQLQASSLHALTFYQS